MKGKTSSVLLVLMFVVGLSVLLYPTISNYMNSKSQSEAIVNYETMLENIEEKDLSGYLAKAQEYNRQLAELPYAMLSYDKVQGYDDLLNLTGNGMMGYLKIDKIGVELPIYHGTDKAVLDVAVGHLEGSSLPVGGSSTHCLLSAHRGLPTAKLFTDLDKLEVGDIFTLTVLGEVITYEVDLIRIVEPHETSKLTITKGEDYCTLITCTPYGINTYRLLVRGSRIDNIEERTIYVSTEAHQIDVLIVTPVVATPMLIALMISFIVKDNKRKKTEKIKKQIEKRGGEE